VEVTLLRQAVSIRYLAAVACLGTTLAGTRLADSRQPDSLVRPLAAIDREILGWRSLEDDTLPGDILQILVPSAYLSRVYQKDKSQLGLFIAYYAQQRAGESMHSPKVCLPGNGWEIVRQGSADIVAAGHSTTINQYHIEHSGRQMLALYWYQSRRRIVASEYVGKLLLIKDAVTSGYTSGSVVRITVNDDPWSAGEALQFAEKLIPQVQRSISDGRKLHPPT